jgi:hypothetical protein
MLRPDPRAVVVPLLASLITAAFVIQSLLCSAAKSPGADEPVHFAGGLSYVQTGSFSVNPQHPPLIKELSGLAALISGARWPKTEEAQRALAGVQEDALAVGNAVIAANGPDHVMFWARLPMILVAALLAVLVFLWGRLMFGAMAGLCALFLYAFDPTIVAHSFSITTDVGAATFCVLFFYSLWRYVCCPTAKRLLWSGLALGAALGAKFSMVFILPVAAILLAVAAIRPPKQSPEARAWFLHLYGAGGENPAKVRPNDPCPCGSGKKFKKCHFDSAVASPSPGLSRALGRSACVFAGLLLIAALVVEAVYLFAGDPLLYWKGLRLVNADHVANYASYLAGSFQNRFYSYFAMAYLLKEPLASIAFVAAGMVVLARRRDISGLQRLFLLLPLAVLFVVHTLWADNLGMRYIIPVLPFLYLIGGLGMAHILAAGSAWKRVLAAVLCLWIVAASWGIHPDGLSYFNEAAGVLSQPRQIGWDGGSRCGPLWLDDSNVDWGQGLKQLSAWQRQHAPGRSIRLDHPLGTFPAAAYGLKHENLGFGDALRDPAPGLYAISAHVVARTPAYGAMFMNGAGAWLRRPPDAIVGHCLYIFDIGPAK